jgi:hypothetical protein
VLRLARQIFLAHDIRIGGFETSCEFSLATDWSEYKRWLRSKMEHQYNTRAETDETIAFFSWAGWRSVHRQRRAYGQCREGRASNVPRHGVVGKERTRVNDAG